MKISISKLVHDESTNPYYLAERNTSYDAYPFDDLFPEWKKVRKFKKEKDVIHKTRGKKFHKNPFRDIISIWYKKNIGWVSY